METCDGFELIEQGSTVLAVVTVESFPDRVAGIVVAYASQAAGGWMVRSLQDELGPFGMYESAMSELRRVAREAIEWGSA